MKLISLKHVVFQVFCFGVLLLFSLSALYQNAILHEIVASQGLKCRETTDSCIRKAIDLSIESNHEQVKTQSKIIEESSLKVK